MNAATSSAAGSVVRAVAVVDGPAANQLKSGSLMVSFNILFVNSRDSGAERLHSAAHSTARDQTLSVSTIS